MAKSLSISERLEALLERARESRNVAVFAVTAVRGDRTAAASFALRLAELDCDLVRAGAMALRTVLSAETLPHNYPPKAEDSSYFPSGPHPDSLVSKPEGCQEPEEEHDDEG